MCLWRSPRALTTEAIRNNWSCVILLKNWCAKCFTIDPTFPLWVLYLNQSEDVPEWFWSDVCVHFFKYGLTLDWLYLLMNGMPCVCLNVESWYFMFTACVQRLDVMNGGFLLCCSDMMATLQWTKGTLLIWYNSWSCYCLVILNIL